MERKCVLIVGSGMMGAGIAACSAAAGNQTILADLDLGRAQNGVETAKEKLRYLWENQLLETDKFQQAQEKLVASGNYLTSAQQARLVIEAVNENMELKQNIFGALDEVLPVSVPIASNTSGLRITEIAVKMHHPERSVTTHFWFPAHLVPLVEVVIGDQTNPAVAECLKDELLRWNKAPVVVKKDLPGQLANRILQAVIREAVNIVEMGLASPEDVDTAVKMGMGIRFPVWGPLEHVDTVGVDLCESVQDTVLPGISGRDCAADKFRELIAEKNLGVKTGKGFYDWSVKDNQALQLLRDRYIVNSLQFLRQQQ